MISLVLNCLKEFRRLVAHRDVYVVVVCYIYYLSNIVYHVKVECVTVDIALV